MAAGADTLSVELSLEAPNAINGIDGVGAGVVFDVEPNEKLLGAGVAASFDGCEPTDKDTAGAGAGAGAGADDLPNEKTGVSETEGGAGAPNDGMGTEELSSFPPRLRLPRSSSAESVIGILPSAGAVEDNVSALALLPN